MVFVWIFLCFAIPAFVVHEIICRDKALAGVPLVSADALACVAITDSVTTVSSQIDGEKALLDLSSSQAERLLHGPLYADMSGYLLE